MYMLSARFLQLARKTSGDTALCHRLWQELREAYSQPARHYHTLAHLAQLFAALEDSPGVIWDDALAYAVFYHDAVYDVLRQDNEAQSARLAGERMASLQVAPRLIAQCRELILATRDHRAAGRQMNYFVDADLSILGAAPQQYRSYCMQVRREYSIYSEAQYRQGRTRVLQHFLSMPHIYKTPFFRERCERQARQNMEQELALLKTGS